VKKTSEFILIIYFFADNNETCSVVLGLLFWSATRTSTLNYRKR